MAIRLRKFQFCGSPLKEINEHLLAISPATGVSVHNAGFKMVIVLQGEANLTVDKSDAYTLASGDVLILPHACGQHYSCQDDGRTTHLHVVLFQWNLRVEEGADDPFVEYLSHTFPKAKYLNSSSCMRLRSLVYKLIHIMQWHDLEAASIIEDVSRLLVMEAAQAAGIYPTPAVPEPWIEAERDYVRLAWDPIRTLPPSSGNFILWAGVNPTRYRNLLRVEAAKELMVHQMEPLAKLAKQVGFRSQSSFSHTFRRVTGISPRDYLKSQSQPVLTNEEPMHKASWLSTPIRIEDAQSMKEATAPSLMIASEDIILTGVRRGNVAFSKNSQELIYFPSKARWKQTEGGKVAVLRLPEQRGIARLFGQKVKGIPLPERRQIELLRSHLRAAEDKPYALHHQLYASSLFKLIAAELVYSLNSNRKVSAHELEKGYRLPLDYATEYLRKHLSTPIRLSDVAWFAGVSEEHLSRSFKRMYRVTIMEYLKKLRLEQAKVYLTSGDQSIGEISGLCGFASLAHFCREFKKATGVTPGDYRLELGKGR